MFYRLLFFLLVTMIFGCSHDKPKSKIHNTEKINLLQEKSRNKKIDYKVRLKLIDSALTIAKNNNLDSLELSLLYIKSDLIYHNVEKDSALNADINLLKRAKELQDNFYAGKANKNIALFFYENQMPDSAFYRYSLSKSYFEKLNDSSEVGRRLTSMALIQKNQNDFFGSKETLTEALQFLRPEKDVKYIASNYSTLGTNHRKLLNYEEAVVYFQKAIEKTESTKNRLTYKNNLAVTYIDSKQYKKAISILKEISNDSILVHTKNHARVLDNLAYAQWLSGENIGAKAFLEPLEIRKLKKDKRGQIASYTHLGEFYSKLNQIKAYSYFDKVIQLSKDLKMPRAEKDALRFLMDIQPANVDIKNRYIFLNDSLYNQELLVKTQFAKLKYDDSRKQEKILRLEKENAQNELEASKQDSQKIMYLCGLVFLASLLGFLIYSFRQRTKGLKQRSKTEKLTAIFQTEAELARRLHDDHGGKLNQTMLLVEGDADKSKILDNLEELYNQSRDFSREINAVDTGSNFWDNVLAMIQLRTPSRVKLFLRGGNEVDWKLQSGTVKTVLFKIVQELMINLGKHSGANTVAITFQETSNGLKMNYEDDGIGASEKEFRLKNGLLNTEKRIEAIGGSIIFDTKKGNGFKAEIQFPK